MFFAASDVLIKLQKIAFLPRHAFLMALQASLCQSNVEVTAESICFQ